MSYAPPAYVPPAYVPPPPPKKKKTWLIVLAVVVSLILILMIGCVALLYSFGKSHLAMTPPGAVANLHLHMTKADDAAIYSESDQAYKDAVTQAQSNEMFDTIHSKLGSPTKMQIIETKSSDLGGQDVISVVVLTTFEKGSANETIEFRKGDDSQYHMTHYGAESDNLR
jgi:hypothetical protein